MSKSLDEQLLGAESQAAASEAVRCAVERATANECRRRAETVQANLAQDGRHADAVSANVLKIASLVRRIVEDVSPELVKGFGIFPTSAFPRGWCQDTSRALGHLLSSRGEPGFELVFAAHPDDDRNTHVWLHRDGLIVDITADQFKNSGCPSVMVTTDDAWHGRWVQKKQPLDEVLAGHADCAIYSAVCDHPDWQELVSNIKYYLKG